MDVEKLLGSTNEAHVQAGRNLLLLSIFPGEFQPWAAAHVLGYTNSTHTWYIDHEVYPLLHQLLPGCLERWEVLPSFHYRVQPGLLLQLRALLALQPALREEGMLRYVDCVTWKVLQDHKRKDQQEIHRREVAYVLELVATQQLSAAALNTCKDGELGMSMCRCMDIMCPPLKVHPCAEPALKLLLEHPHDPACPFCIFHLYPTLHAQGKLQEMDQWLELIPQRTPFQDGGDVVPYHGVDIKLDYLTSKAYSLLLQGRGQEAELLTRRVLAMSKMPWQRLNNTNNLVFALRQQGKLHEALEATQTLGVMLANDEVEQRFRSESLLAVALVYRDLGLLDAAEATLMQAVATARLLDDEDVDDMRLYTCYHAAKVLLRQQDKVKASRAVLLAEEARQHAARWCLPGHSLPPRIQVLFVDAVIALYTLPAEGSPPAPPVLSGTLPASGFLPASNALPPSSPLPSSSAPAAPWDFSSASAPSGPLPSSSAPAAPWDFSSASAPSGPLPPAQPPLGTSQEPQGLVPLAGAPTALPSSSNTPPLEPPAAASQLPQGPGLPAGVPPELWAALNAFPPGSPRAPAEPLAAAPHLPQDHIGLPGGVPPELWAALPSGSQLPSSQPQAGTSHVPHLPGPAAGAPQAPAAEQPVAVPHLPQGLGLPGGIPPELWAALGNPSGGLSVQGPLGDAPDSPAVAHL